MSNHAYPVQVDATLQPDLSRWLWLVKWILVIPHYIVLAFLWLAFLMTTVVAFFAILVTGRYPRGIFDFNVGVLRWSWRVAYYAYGGLGTDQYPPFSLEERPDYPAHLEVAYPEHLSRGLALVKWWLLAIPHYLVLGLFLGGGWYVASDADAVPGVGGWGLIQVLVLVAGVVLLATGGYPRGVFDLVLGLNRWVLRVAAYAALMTDDYPPFRLDLGGDEPATGGGVALRHALEAVQTDPVAPPQTPRRIVHQAPPVAPPPGPPRGWGAGRVVAVVVSSLMLLTSFGLLAAGGSLLVAADVVRDDDGYLVSPTVELRTKGHALVTEDLRIRNDSVIVDLPERLFGTVKVEATSDRGDVFVGLADSEDVATYLAGVGHSTVVDPLDEYGEPTYEFTDGGAPALLPEAADIWTASAVGAGTQEITFTPEEGDWTVVVMNADGAAPVESLISVGATLPWLDEAGVVLLAGGLVLLAGGSIGLWLALRRS